MTSPFSFRGGITRARYFMASCAVLLASYAVRVCALLVTDNPLQHNLVLSPSVPRQLLESWPGLGLQSGLWWLLTALAAEIVLAWLMLALAVRRARSTDQSMLFACLAIVPIIQIAPILALGCSPDSNSSLSPAGTARVPVGVAFKGLLAGVVVTILLVLLSTLVFGSYGLGLFLASPFIVGCITGFLGNRRGDIGVGATARLVLAACFLGAVGLLAFAVEGIICLLMAMPLIALMAWIGGLIGRVMALKGPARTPARTALSIVIVPLLFTHDLVAPPNAIIDSVESIDIKATDLEVWNAVVHMGPIPDPPAAPFRWGLAYPMSGRIFGSGVGAIREGVFSTGVAYERVTEWDPASKLSFVVLSDPPTMHELSPYRQVNAPHVNGYFRTLDARFTITRLEDGRTRLSLATRHTLGLDPVFYWLPIAKWAIHANKTRVLAHFAKQAEAAADAPAH